MMNLKVVTSNVLQEKVNALKKVCNPTCFSGNYAYYKIKSDIPTTEAYQMRLVADGLYSSEDSSVLSLIAYIDDATTISGNLSGLESMYIGLGSYVGDNNIAKYCIIVDSYGLQSLSAELFCGDLGDDEFDAKNHIVSIEGTDTLDEGVALIEIQNVNTLRDFYFYYVADDGHLMRVDNGGTVLSIDRSATSGQTENLKNSINVSVNSAVSSSVQITGLGTINSDLSGCSITLNAGQLPSPTVTIPVATTTELGGIKLFNSDSELLDGAYRVKLDLNNKAYVEVPKPDIHRYASLDNLTNLPIGTIVQYIGTTTDQYRSGYFYQYCPTDFTVDSLPNDSTWYALANIADTIKAYNATINYSLSPGVGINVSLVDESGSDESGEEILFAVSLGSNIAYMTYAEVLNNLGIQLKPGYTEEDATDITIYWRVATNSDFVWVLKNVLPMVQMASALTYKGTCAWADLETITLTAEKGDFYTISDRSNQEYVFNGTVTLDWLDSWEFLGEFIVTYEAGHNINISPDRHISAIGYNYNDTYHSFTYGYAEPAGALYPAGVIKATGTGSHAEGYADAYGTIEATGNGAHAEGYSNSQGTMVKASGDGSHAEGVGTTASGAYSHAEGDSTEASGGSSHAEGDSCTASGAASHAEGNGTTASGINSHAEGNDTLASNYNSHAEGYLTIAQNVSEHAEGFCNVSHKASDTYGNAGNTQHSVGIGINNNSRKNAFEIMQNGDAYMLGVGLYDGTNPTSADSVQTVLNSKVTSSTVMTLWSGTQQLYDAIVTKDANTLYIIVSV